MTVMGLNKNALDTLFSQLAVQANATTPNSSESSDFLKILSMLSDEESPDSKIDKLLEVSSLSTTQFSPNLGLLDQLGLSKENLRDVISKINVSNTGNNSALTSKFINFLGDEAIKDVVLSDAGNPLKIRSDVESLREEFEKLNVEVGRLFEVASPDQQPSQSIDRDTDVRSDVLFKKYPQISNTLNFDLLQSSDNTSLTIDAAKLVSSLTKEGKQPQVVKFLINQEKPSDRENPLETENPLDTENIALDLTKINIKVDLNETRLDLISLDPNQPPESVSIPNPKDTKNLVIQVDKNNIEALALQINLPDLGPEFGDLPNNQTDLPKITILFEKQDLSNTINNKPIQVDVREFRVNTSEKSQHFLVEMPKAPELGRSNSQLEINVGEQTPELKTNQVSFIEFGKISKNLDKNELAVVLKKFEQALDKFNPVEFKVSDIKQDFSQRITGAEQNETISTTVANVAAKVLNLAPPKLRSNLLSTTANFLRSREVGLKLLQPSSTVSNADLEQKLDFLGDVSLDDLFAEREQQKGKQGLPLPSLDDANTTDDLNILVKTLKVPNHGSSQISSNINIGQIQASSASNVVNVAVSQNPSLQVFDAQFNSRLGMLLTDKILMAQENFELQLEPESFGKVRVNVSLDNLTLEVKMTAENIGAVSVLRGAEAILQNITDQNGLKLSDYSVDMQNNNGNSKNGGNNEQSKSANDTRGQVNPDRVPEIVSENKAPNEQILNLLA